MTKLLVLYYSMYGQFETMAGAVAAGAREVAGVEVAVERVPVPGPPCRDHRQTARGVTQMPGRE